MVNNSSNINKTKESLNSDSQQFLQYQRGIVDHHSLSFLCFVEIGGIVDYHYLNFLLICWYWRNYWPSLLKLSFSLWKWNSDGQQFHQYQKNKRKLKQWWSTFPPISTKQRNLSSDGQQFHQYEQIEKSRQWWSTFPIVDYHFLNFLLFCWYWRNCWLSLFKLFFFFFLYWWNCWPSLFKLSWLVDIGRIVHHHYLSFLFFVEQNKRKFRQW
jgi:hypothetical protein